MLHISVEDPAVPIKKSAAASPTEILLFQMKEKTGMKEIYEALKFEKIEFDNRNTADVILTSFAGNGGDVGRGRGRGCGCDTSHFIRNQRTFSSGRNSGC